MHLFKFVKDNGNILCLERQKWDSNFFSRESYNLNIDSKLILLDPVFSNSPKKPVWIDIIKKRGEWNLEDFLNTKPFNSLPDIIKNKLSELEKWPSDPLEEHRIYSQYPNTKPIIKENNKKCFIYTCQYNSPTMIIPYNCFSDTLVKYHFSWFNNPKLLINLIEQHL